MLKTYSPLSQILLTLISFSFTLVLASCGTTNVEQYEATAITTLTWQVNYMNDPSEAKRGRFEEFASSSIANINGQKPEGKVVGPDDKGLWWPTIPAKPTLDEIENRQKRPYEKPGKPELLRTVKYYITYQKDGQVINLPTNYSVYRQVVKAYPEGIPLKLTMGINNGSVEKAEPLN
ncbi:MAG: hypothetical protein QNJ41_20325 [Xenococcaceae cyanobacterium MO_188.B32]|nr:hypothetical protein [Xenococcaceae cyanobacterium MO_188.B32]